MDDPAPKKRINANYFSGMRSANTHNASNSEREVGLSYRLTTIISATGIFLLPAGCFTTCFIAGTRIHTPSGPKPIEALTVGEAVWAWCNETQQPVARPIVRLFRGESRETFRIQAGEFVVEGVTGEHPF